MPFEFDVLDNYETQAVNWLWHPYVPYGALTLIFGRPGIGKSHITMDLAARLSRGEPLPGQEKGLDPQRVLILSAEDSPTKVLRPRLEAVNANFRNIYIPKTQFALDRTRVKELISFMKDFGVTIVFIDPIAYYMGGKIDMNKQNEVRSIMAPLAEAADAADAALIIVGHTRKGSDGEDFEKAMGSQDFTAAVRSSLFITTDGEGHKVMKHVKSNYAREGRTLGFHFDNNDKVFWDMEYDEVTGKTIGPIAAPAKPATGARGRAVKFLKEILRDGPVPSRVLEHEAEALGFNPRTLFRAKQGVAESFYKRDKDGILQWYWRLVGDHRTPFDNVVPLAPDTDTEAETVNLEAETVTVTGPELDVDQWLKERGL